MISYEVRKKVYKEMRKKKYYYDHGDRIGDLVFLEEVEQIKNDRFAVFRCFCGKEFRVRIDHVRRGARTSCGCVGKLARIIKSGQNPKHKHLSEYHAYFHAKDRCNNRKSASYPDYGGRGIKFRFTSFQEFIDHIGPKPTPKHSIDRINNNGHYEIGNVRWATSEIQNRNTRHNVYLEFNGKRLTIKDWSAETTIHWETIRRRIECKWCVACTLTIPTDGGTCSHKPPKPIKFLSTKTRPLEEMVRLVLRFNGKVLTTTYPFLSRFETDTLNRNGYEMNYKDGINSAVNFEEFKRLAKRQFGIDFDSMRKGRKYKQNQNIQI